ncbi:hypothetical protein GCM10027057_03480 [Marisediminicola antarctica]|uniref:Uncharacterized protein n=1 Tax=Marisediminicola antarctica TaxID=674079 RepID=A0A7L5AHQ3_9MICO|nr:hypothetical protein BHD05_11135 [Marisediminicola antarctica]
MAVFHFDLRIPVLFSLAWRPHCSQFRGRDVFVLGSLDVAVEGFDAVAHSVRRAPFVRAPGEVLLLSPPALGLSLDRFEDRAELWALLASIDLAAAEAD